jgi:hypothetical protein
MLQKFRLHSSPPTGIEVICFVLRGGGGVGCHCLTPTSHSGWFARARDPVILNIGRVLLQLPYVRPNDRVTQLLSTLWRSYLGVSALTI